MPRKRPDPAKLTSSLRIDKSQGKKKETKAPRGSVRGVVAAAAREVSFDAPEYRPLRRSSRGRSSAAAAVVSETFNPVPSAVPVRATVRGASPGVVEPGSFASSAVVSVARDQKRKISQEEWYSDEEDVSYQVDSPSSGEEDSDYPEEEWYSDEAGSDYIPRGEGGRLGGSESAAGVDLVAKKSRTSADAATSSASASANPQEKIKNMLGALKLIEESESIYYGKASGHGSNPNTARAAKRNRLKDPEPAEGSDLAPKDHIPISDELMAVYEVVINYPDKGNKLKREENAVIIQGLEEKLLKVTDEELDNLGSLQDVFSESYKEKLIGASLRITKKRVDVLRDTTREKLESFLGPFIKLLKINRHIIEEVGRDPCPQLNRTAAKAVTRDELMEKCDRVFRKFKNEEAVTKEDLKSLGIRKKTKIYPVMKKQSEELQGLIDQILLGSESAQGALKGKTIEWLENELDGVKIEIDKRREGEMRKRFNTLLSQYSREIVINNEAGQRNDLRKGLEGVVKVKMIRINFLKDGSKRAGEVEKELDGDRGLLAKVESGEFLDKSELPKFDNRFKESVKQKIADIKAGKGGSKVRTSSTGSTSAGAAGAASADSDLDEGMMGYGNDDIVLEIPGDIGVALNGIMDYFTSIDRRSARKAINKEIMDLRPKLSKLIKDDLLIDSLELINKEFIDSNDVLRNRVDILADHRSDSLNRLVNKNRIVKITEELLKECIALREIKMQMYSVLEKGNTWKAKYGSGTENLRGALQKLKKGEGLVKSDLLSGGSKAVHSESGSAFQAIDRVLSGLGSIKEGSTIYSRYAGGNNIKNVLEELSIEDLEKNIDYLGDKLKEMDMDAIIKVIKRSIVLSQIYFKRKGCFDNDSMLKDSYVSMVQEALEMNIKLRTVLRGYLKIKDGDTYIYQENSKAIELYKKAVGEIKNKKVISKESLLVRPKSSGAKSTSASAAQVDDLDFDNDGDWGFLGGIKSSRDKIDDVLKAIADITSVKKDFPKQWQRNNIINRENNDMAILLEKLSIEELEGNLEYLKTKVLFDGRDRFVEKLARFNEGKLQRVNILEDDGDLIQIRLERVVKLRVILKGFLEGDAVLTEEKDRVKEHDAVIANYKKVLEKSIKGTLTEGDLRESKKKSKKIFVKADEVSRKKKVAGVVEEGVIRSRRDRGRGRTTRSSSRSASSVAPPETSGELPPLLGGVASAVASGYDSEGERGLLESLGIGSAPLSAASAAAPGDGEFDIDAWGSPSPGFVGDLDDGGIGLHPSLGATVDKSQSQSAASAAASSFGAIKDQFDLTGLEELFDPTEDPDDSALYGSYPPGVDVGNAETYPGSTYLMAMPGSPGESRHEDPAVASSAAVGDGMEHDDALSDWDAYASSMDIEGAAAARNSAGNNPGFFDSEKAGLPTLESLMEGVGLISPSPSTKKPSSVRRSQRNR